MQITKCDICKKVIGQKDGYVSLAIRDEAFSSFELCADCGEPIKKILEKNKLIKTSNIKKNGK